MKKFSLRKALTVSRRRLMIAAAASMAFGAAQPGFAQTYPTKPIKIVVNSAPGGLTDVLARLIGAKMTASHGQPMIIENRPGAAGLVGAEAVSSAAPDGYTVGVVASAITVAPALVANSTFNAAKDLTPIALMQHIKSGRVRGLGVTGQKRGLIAPDVPTMAEAGFPGVEVTGWIGVFAGGGTPREVLVRIAEETQRALRMPDIVARIPGWGGEAAGTMPEEFEARYRADIVKYARIIREAKVPLLD